MLRHRNFELETLTCFEIMMSSVVFTECILENVNVSTALLHKIEHHADIQ